MEQFDETTATRVRLRKMDMVLVAVIVALVVSLIVCFNSITTLSNEVSVLEVQTVDEDAINAKIDVLVNDMDKVRETLLNQSNFNASILEANELQATLNDAIISALGY